VQGKGKSHPTLGFEPRPQWCVSTIVSLISRPYGITISSSVPSTDCRRFTLLGNIKEVMTLQVGSLAYQSTYT